MDGINTLGCPLPLAASDPENKTTRRNDDAQQGRWCCFFFDYQGGLFFPSCMCCLRRATLTDTLKTRTNKPFTHQPFSLHISFHLILHDRIKRAASVKKNDSRIYIFIIGSFSHSYIFTQKALTEAKRMPIASSVPFQKTQVVLFSDRFLLLLLLIPAQLLVGTPKRKKRTRYCMPYTFSFGYIRSHFFSFPLKKS